MSILAMDTSSAVSSVAVLKEGRIASEITMHEKLTHSETLLSHVQNALTMAKIEREAITGIAVSVGPGSFTGLRIGLAAAKAMAYALEIPLAAVPTMHALACHYPVPGLRVMALVDAQKQNVYRAIFAWDGDAPRCIKDTEVLPLEAVLKECEAEECTVVLGDAAVKYFNGKIALPPNAFLAPPMQRLPRAAHVAYLGARMIEAGEISNVMDLEPIYLRKSEAEVLWEQRQK